MTFFLYRHFKLENRLLFCYVVSSEFKFVDYMIGTASFSKVCKLVEECSSRLFSLPSGIINSLSSSHSSWEAVFKFTLCPCGDSKHRFHKLVTFTCLLAHIEIETCIA